MKKAILYIRVSTDEQANTGFSLRDQKDKLLKYCESNNIEVLKIFKEDYSAKTFKRPQYTLLWDFAEKHKKETDLFLFTKWDRFSRNAAESYEQMKNFEKLNIQLHAIEQPLDLSSPEQLLMLAVYLSVPEVENKRRSLNVIAGMRRSFKEGRYLGSTPQGYTSEKDKKDKPILVPNHEASAIKKAFNLIAKGNVSQRKVMDILEKDGVKVSRTRISKLLRNPVYKGYIILKKFKDEPAELIKGIHEPIVSEYVFQKVQDVLSAGKKNKVQYKSKNLAQYPLRGLILCELCGNNLSASSPKGNGGHYDYYHCANGCKKSFRTELLHNELETILTSLKPKPEVIEVYTKLLSEGFKIKNGSQAKQKEQNNKSIKLINDKIRKTQDLFIDGKIEHDDFKQITGRFKTELLNLENKKLNYKKLNINQITQTISWGFGFAENIGNYYENSDLDTKRDLIGSMFPEKFTFENGELRTTKIEKTFLLIANKSKGLKRIKKRDVSLFEKTSLSVPREGFEPTTSGV